MGVQLLYGNGLPGAPGQGHRCGRGVLGYNLHYDKRASEPIRKTLS